MLLALAAGCGKGEETPQSSDSDVETESPETSISLNVNKVSVCVGETFQLVPNVSEDKEGALVFWWILNEQVATVDENGLITAVGVGTTVCYAQCGVTIVPCSVTVTERPLTASFSFSLTKTTYNLNGGDSYNLLSDVTVKFGNETVTEYLLSGEVNGDSDVTASVENGVVTVGTTTGSVELLLTVSAEINGETYTAQQLITINVY